MALFSSGNTLRFSFNVPGTEFLVVDLKARERISAIYEVDLTLASEDVILFEDVVGKTALLGIESTDTTRFFHGVVNQFIQTGIQGRFFLYQARIVPQVWLLSLEQDCRIFQKMKVPDIIKQILEDSGITSDIFEFRLQFKYQPREYCVQYRETDLAFISRLLEEEGIYYFFEHTSDKHVLVFGDETVCYKPIEGDDNVTFKPRSGMVSEQETVFNFMLKREICSGKYTLRDFNYANPDLDLTADKIDKKNKIHEIYDYPGEYATTEEGKRLAKIRLQEALTYKFKAEGDSSCPRFTAGFTFNLEEHDVSNFNQQYLIYDVTHTGSQSQVLQEHATDEGGTHYNNLFYAVPSDVTYRPQRKTPRPVVEGVQTAIVTGKSGEEIHTDKYGRVKVQFHWDRLGKKDDKSSCWIRVSQLAAGGGWGAMDIPRIGHEVIVDFIEGDPDRPIITGRVYHGTNLPPFALPDSKMVHGMKSNTTPGGGGFNEISMNDTKDKEMLNVHAQKDMTETIKNNLSISVGGNRSVTVSGTNSETIKKDASFTIQDGSRTVSVTGGDYTVTASDAVMLYGKGKGVGITGDTDGIGITGNGKGVGITGNGEGVGITGNDKGVGITGNGEGVGITGNGKGVSITGNDDGVSIIGTPDAYVEGKSKVTLSSPEVNIGDKQININGTKVVISAGGGSITIDAMGVTINGTLVKIN